MKDRIFIGDRYEVLSKVGAGGMADVYKGKDHKLNRFVAIKILKKEYREDEIFVKKFQSEAQAAAGLMHPNIVNVYDVGEEQGLYYMVMELVEGITLKEYIHKKGMLSPKETISIAIQVANGIEAAHLHQIVHRDIKPQNIIISKEGKVKVTDFGIAKVTSSNTISTNALGSVHYTSPEQARGGYSDYKSDIYSLGITIYEMVTGKVPFDGDSPVAIAIKHLQEEITPPSEYVDIPYSLEQIILKCTQKNADRRYQNVNELREDLKRSLVDPDGDFVKIGPMRLMDETVLFKPEEMDRIQRESKRNIRDVYVDDDYEEDYDEDDEEEYDDEFDEAYEEEPRSRKKGKSADVNEKMAKMMKILTIIAVVIIIFIMIFIVGKATGMLKFGPSKHAIEEEEKKEVSVPSVLGKTEEEADKVLDQMNLGITVKGTEESEDYEEGQIIRQDPVEGTKVKENTTVNVWISSGKKSKEAEVPSVSGMSQSDAIEALRAKGFEKTSVEFESSSAVSPDEVIRTKPGQGTLVSVDTEIVLVINKGEEKPEVPNVVGKTIEEAKAKLEGKSLTYTISEEYHESYKEGVVFHQGIHAGSRVSKGTSVALKVSKGKKPEEKITVPDIPEGTSEQYAVNVVKGSGLVPKVIYIQSDLTKGRVVSCEPGSGTSVSPGSTIKIYVSKGPEVKPEPGPDGEDTQGNQSGEGDED